MNSFKKEIQALISVKKEYENRLDQLRTSADKEVTKFEYSKGGEVMHRGYYCPSPIFEYIYGNVKRGRLLKRKPDFGKFSYEYGFNKDGRLIRVKGVNEFTTPNSHFDEEYLIYDQDIV